MSNSGAELTCWIMRVKKNLGSWQAKAYQHLQGELDDTDTLALYDLICHTLEKLRDIAKGEQIRISELDDPAEQDEAIKAWDLRMADAKQLKMQISRIADQLGEADERFSVRTGHSHKTKLSSHSDSNKSQGLSALFDTTQQASPNPLSNVSVGRTSSLKTALEHHPSPVEENVIEKANKIFEKFKDELKSISGTQDSYTTPKTSPNIGKGIESLTLESKLPESCRVESKLPKITIPKFDGTPEKYIEFMQTFTERVHNQKMTSQDKMFYLLQHLTGEAKAAIEGYPVTNENYERCLQILKTEYGSNEEIVFSLLQSLDRIPAPRDQYNSLRDFVNAVCTTLRRLEGLDSHDDEKFVIKKLKSKLPLSWRQEYAKEYKYGLSPSFTEFQRFLRERLQEVRNHGLTTEETTRNPTKDSRKPWNPPLLSAPAPPKPFVKSTTISEVNSLKTPRCFFCNQQGHPCRLCPTVKSREERLKIVGDRCRNCFGTRHKIDECKSQKTCFICNEKHHTSLCNKKRNVTAAAFANETSDHSLLVASVKTNAPQKSVLSEAVALFDTGSNTSFISSQLASRLNLKALTVEPVLINGFGGNTHTEQSRLVKFEIQSEHGPIEILANTIKRIVKDPIEIKSTTGQSSQRNVDILIGLDYFFKFFDVPREVKDDKVVVRSSVGDVILYPKKATKPMKVGLLAINSFSDQERRAWKAEYGDLMPVRTPEDLQTLKFFDDTTTKADRYTVCIPFKDGVEDLPTNFGLARGQLTGTLCRLAKDPDKLDEYDRIINEQVEAGILEPAPYRTDGKVHYLPHHPVFKNESLTTKTRIVINCSAKASPESPSLNDKVHQGPDLLPQLIGIVLRSRTRVFFVSGDVEKAFHQIELEEKDRDYVRILWLRDTDQPLTNENLIAYRFARVLFGLKTSPFLLLAVLRLHLSKSEGTEHVIQNTYVDNIFIFTDDKQFALAEKDRIKAMLASAKMNLRAFFSNDADIEHQFDPSEAYQGDKTKILGIDYDRHEDCFVYCIQLSDSVVQWTPAGIIKAILQFFDPMGFLLPVFVPIKAFIHRVIKSKHPQKKPLKPEDLVEWSKMLRNFFDPTVVRVPRFIGKGVSYELHVFSDASSTFIAAAAYIRVHLPDGAYRSHLLMSKSRVKDDLVPLEDQKIPKLELVGIVLAAELMEKVTIELDIHLTDRYIWTDSQICLAWLNKCPEIPFVARRLPGILKMQCNFGFVQSQFNPADLPTRGCLPSELPNHSHWWHGPAWLSLEKSKWPNPASRVSPAEISVRWVLTANRTQSVAPALPLDPISQKHHAQFIDLSRFSSFTRAVSVTVLVLKATNIFLSLLNRRRPTEVEKKMQDSISAARKLLLKLEQERYSSVLDSCDKVANRNGMYVFVDRYKNAKGVLTSLPVLPKQSRLAELLVLHVHRYLQHAGVTQTLANLRTHAWILKARQLVNDMIKTCPTCRRYLAKPFKLPDFPDHPEERVNPAEAFKFIGLDYFGPLTTRANDKRYGLLLTCLTTRAIHIEFVIDLSVVSFVQAFSCFTSRRRFPKVVYSDNASTFKSASKLFQTVSQFPEDPHALAFFQHHNIVWRFTTERSPWKGGCYERLIGVVKASYKKVVGRQMLNDTELRTVLTILEAAANKRPLTYINTDTLKAVRPCDFIGQSDPDPLLVPNAETDEEAENDPTWMPAGPAGREELLTKLARHNKFIDSIWKEWSHQYLDYLRERQSVAAKNPRSVNPEPPSPGDVVLVYDENKPRQFWQLAIVKEINKSTDGEVRSATITTANGNIKNRPLSHLYLLEMAETSDDAETSA